MPISAETATDIALAYREIETAEKLLKEILAEKLTRGAAPDIRDAFGRHQDGLQLGVPSGSGGHRLFNVPWVICKSVIELHIAQQRTRVEVLCEKAMIEMRGVEMPGETSIEP